MDVAQADILDAVSNMTVLELSQLIKEMEEKFGVSAPPLRLRSPRPLRRQAPPPWRRRPSSP